MKNTLITLCLLFFSVAAWAQTRTITGRVIGGQKDTLIGAIVNQKGTSNAVPTEADGSFSLMVPEGENVVLIVSYSGYKNKEINVGTESTINISLEEDSPPDEFVVIGYGRVKKSNLTGPVSKLSANEVKQVPGGNVLDNVQGKIAGADITTSSGETGKAPTATIRGNRSITANNGPLFIVDGVQYSSIQDINPNDIVSMEVLKDASTTAIYGSRGANGVFIVTTKTGAAGIPKASVNFYSGVSQPFAFPEPMTGQQFADAKLERFRTLNPGVANPTYSTSGVLTPEELEAYNNGTSINAVDEVLHNGSQTDFQASLSGGTDRIKTYFSLDYFNEKGLLKNDELKRYTGRLNLEYQAYKFLKVGTQTQITFYDHSRRTNPLNAAVQINPLVGQMFDANGMSILNPNGSSSTIVNPLTDEQANTAENQLNTTRIFPTIYAEVQPFQKGALKDLTGRTNFSVNWDNRSNGVFNALNSFARAGSATAQATYENAQRTQLNWQGILNYNTSLDSGNHNFGATLLSEIITNKTEIYRIESYGQLLPSQSYHNLSDNSSRLTSSSYAKSDLISFAARFNYDYKGKYLLSMTGRTDGSSVLAPGHKWDFFPSIAAAWRISEEKFFGMDYLFSNVKIRGSWGIAGNANINPYSTQSLLARVPYAAWDEKGVTAYAYRPQIGNKETEWEKSTTWDVGLDMGFLKDRITVTYDYYFTETSDVLLTKQLPPSTGVSSTVSNIGSTQNQGHEITAYSVNIDTKKFMWATTLTFMRNREKIIALDNNVQTMIVMDADDNSKTVVVGSPVNSFYDYEKIGLWQSNEGEAIANFNTLNPTIKVEPGAIKIKDQNGDGVITPADRVVVGSSVPKWSAGFNSEFKFLNFDASFYLFSRVGQTINYTYSTVPGPTNSGLSTREYWTPENATNDMARPGLITPTLFQNTNRYVNGSFLKLRSATIGYTFNVKDKKDEEGNVIAKKFSFSRLRLYVTGKNLFVVAKTKHYDPEMDGTLTFPTTRLIIGGVNIDF